MYSKKLQEMLKGIRVGEEIIVKKSDLIYRGVLLPSTDFSDSDTLIIKLDNGYNIGLKHDRTMSVSRGGKESEEIKKEVRIELGKARTVKKMEFDLKKPKISLIATGGTIGSRADYVKGGVSAHLSPEELLAIAPELSDLVYIKDISIPFNVMSENMNPKHYQELAKEAAKELKKGEGVVITHGTDTLHYTAAALSFMLPDLSKPVVLTGSQRSSDRGSSDAAINLICSANLAGYSDIAEVGICMHGTSSDDFCLFNRGTKVRKMHTSRRDTFRPINELPLAKVSPDGKIEILNKSYRKKTDSETKADTKFETKVALLKAYPGANPEIVDFLLDKNYKGFVIEAHGLGQVATEDNSWLPHIKKAIDAGASVCFAAQTIYGRLDPFVYSEARKAYELGVIYCEDMMPEVAYIKLGWVLGHTNDQSEVKARMLMNLAGEITDRTMPQTFLY
jgi:glutamyl-tRNA(Gln) amidotransferase subunit D